MKSGLLDEAIRVAILKREQHPMHRRGYKLFSFIVEKNKILGYGVNNRDFLVPAHYGYNVRHKGWGVGFAPCIHSEIDAFRKNRGIIKGPFDLINVRITDSNNIGMSKPCSCCCEWMRSNGCKDIHFTTNNGWAKLSLT